MATYKNKRTGAVIATDLKISGGSWELVPEKKETAKAKPKKAKTNPPDEGGSDE